MLRRVARVVRLTLIVFAVLLVLWIPFSFVRVTQITTPPHVRLDAVFVARGAASFWLVTGGLLLSDEALARERRPGIEILPSGWPAHVLSRKSASVIPRTTPLTVSGSARIISVPLWLLAFICLAWPVTSFILARRRRKGRGFEVEARPGAAVPPPGS